MSSALKPVLTPGGPQNSSVPPQMNKPMHPQGPPATYGQPSHMPQGLVNLPHNAPTPAHNPSNIHHTNVHSSQNHYSLNVPNAAQHYGMSGNVPMSVSNQGVSYSTPNKNPSFPPTYQPNLGHPPNVTPAQNLPAAPPQPAAIPYEPQEKLQSNGTPDVKNNKPEQNHISPPKDRLTPLSPEKAKLSPEKPPTPPPTSSEDISNDDKEPEVSPVDSSEQSLSSASTTESLPADSTNTTCENVDEPAPVASNESESTTVAEEENPSVPDEAKSEPPLVTTTESTAPSKSREQVIPKSTMKLATTPRTPSRKVKTSKAEVVDSPKSSKATEKTTANKSPSSLKVKRTRIRTQPYQSPLPEIEIISKMTSVGTPRNKSGDEKLIIFYKNEFLAVRNSEGGFYICQAVQNIYKSSPRIRIRWLSQDKNDKTGEIYTPDFYDHTDFDCILTNLSLGRVDKGKFRLPPAEKTRTDSILQRALAVEKGDATPPSLTEEHPDGLDLSLYKEESQLKKGKAQKRKASSPLKTEKKPSVIKKSPEQPKVKKVVSKPKPKPVKKVVPKKAPVEVKRSAVAVPTSTPSRSERAKKRQETPSSSKSSPVVDHKKAKVLAKVARKTAIPTSKSQTTSGNKSHAKTKSVPPPAKPQKTMATTRSQEAAARKTKRTRK